MGTFHGLDGGVIYSICLALSALGCAPSARPSAVTTATATRPSSVDSKRPEPRTIIEDTPPTPFESGYIGPDQTSTVRYSEHVANSAPILPFVFGYGEQDFHLMAYFDGHPTLEAVECMVEACADCRTTRRIHAIATDHQNRQTYYFNYDPPTILPASVTAHRTDITCAVDPDWLKAKLAWTLVNGDAVSLDYVGYAPPDPQWSMVVDPGAHNPDGGLVVMLTSAGNIATTGSIVHIAGKPYPIVPYEKSAPPYFVGLLSYLNRDFKFAYLNTYAELPLVLVKSQDDKAASSIAPFVANGYSQQVLSKQGISETAAIVGDLEKAHDPDHRAQLRFNPPLPNLAAMTPGTAASLRFEILLANHTSPVVYGRTEVHRTADQAVVEMLPAFPAWAALNHNLRCTVSLSASPFRGRCEAMHR